MNTNEQVLALIKERQEIGQKKYGGNIPLKGEGGRDNLKESVEEILDLTVYLGAVLLETKNTRDADSKQNRKQVNPEEIKMMLKGLHMLQSESYRENQMQYANKVGDLIKNIKESCKWSEEDEKSIGRSNTINTEQVTGPTKCIEGSNCD
tara:strand:+ start:6451 stop:6900 length:450 start_codon:yes stop_codon:yes gene_type:complete